MNPQLLFRFNPALSQLKEGVATHLNWDTINNNGIIISPRYPNGELFFNIAERPIQLPAGTRTEETWELDENGQELEGSRVTNEIPVEALLLDGSIYFEFDWPLHAGTGWKRNPSESLTQWTPEQAQVLLTHALEWEQTAGQSGNPSDEELKAEILRYIASQEMRLAATPIAVGEHLIQADQGSRSTLLERFNLMQVNAETSATWLTQENEFIEISLEDFTTLINQLWQQKEQAKQAARALKDSLVNKTREELLSMDLNLA